MSSFLHDEKTYIPILISSLQKHAADPILNPVSVAKKLVNSLSRQLTAQPEPPNIASAGDSELKVDNLQSLGTLLKWLSTSKVTIDGGRVAYTGEETKTLPEGEQNKLSPVTINESRDAATRKWNAVDYHANLPVLISYVEYLQKKAASMTKGGDVQGKVLEVMVGKLIDQIKVIKPDSKLSRKPKSSPENPNEIPDEDQIDDFGSKILDVKNPVKDRGSLILKAKHIKSRAALNTWLQDAPEAQVVMYDEKGQAQKPLPYTDPKVDHCLVINTLYARAKYWQQLAKDDKQEKAFAFYVKKMQEIGPSFADPNGKACTVTGTLTAPGQPGDKKPGQQPGQPKFDPLVAQKVVAALPLRVETFDFDRIDQFFEEYAKLNPNVTQWASPASQYMMDASNLTIHKMRTFSMLSGARDVMTWLKPPQANQGNPYVPFLNQLKAVLNMVGSALQDLKKRYADAESGESMIQDKTQIARINAQIMGSNSIWESNNNAIETLLNQVGSVTPLGPKKYTY
jgi:hypothetical protein